MKFGAMLVKAGMGLAPLLVVLAMGAPAAKAKGQEIIVAPVLHPSDCGPYTDATYTDLSDALNGLSSGTVLVCPGLYATMAHAAYISDASGVTVRRAVADAPNNPVIPVNTGAVAGIYVESSKNVTIDGLTLDEKANTWPGNTGIIYQDSSGAVKNTLIIGPGSSLVNAQGMAVFTTGAGMYSVKMSNVHLFGFRSFALAISGGIKFAVSGLVVNGTDGGRITSSTGGIMVNGENAGLPAPVGSITHSSITATGVGIVLQEASKIGITNNVIEPSADGIDITMDGVAHSADGNRVTGNVITGVNDSNIGILVAFVGGTSFTSRKTVITGNTITGYRLGYNGSGIVFATGSADPGTFTGTVSKNIIAGFNPNNDIFNSGGGAILTISGNDVGG